MNFKKTLSAILAGVMLTAAAVSVSAGNVYTSEDFFKAPVTQCSPYYNYYKYYNGCWNNGYYFNNGYFYAPDCDGLLLESYWNPMIGQFGTCACGLCEKSIVPSGYYWINGIYTSAHDYCTKYAVSTAPVQTVEVKAESDKVAEETAPAQTTSRIPASAIKRKPAASAASNATTSSAAGNVIVQNPGFSSCITIPGKYYAYNQVDIEAYFAKNTYSLYLYPDDVQTFGTGFKMISSNNSVVKIVSDENGQHLKAVGVGSANVYLYTNGGVPFMKLYVGVTNKGLNLPQGYIDVAPAAWQLAKVGDSTDVIVKADKQYDDIKLQVVRGNAYIGNDGKLYATGKGAVVLRAYSEKYPTIQGFAIVYVGQYVNALYDGYWTSANGCITGNYWNPNLWNCGGYKVVGWVLTVDGIYVPVISKGNSVVVKPETDKKPSSSTTIGYTDIYDLLYGHCDGNVNSLYLMLWQKYNGLINPGKSFYELYGAALQEILDDITANYDNQLR